MNALANIMHVPIACMYTNSKWQYPRRPAQIWYSSTNFRQYNKLWNSHQCASSVHGNGTSGCFIIIGHTQNLDKWNKSTVAMRYDMKLMRDDGYDHDNVFRTAGGIRRVWIAMFLGWSWRASWYSNLVHYQTWCSKSVWETKLIDFPLADARHILRFYLTIDINNNNMEE